MEVGWGNIDVPKTGLDQANQRLLLTFAVKLHKYFYLLSKAFQRQDFICLSLRDNDKLLGVDWHCSKVLLMLLDSQKPRPIGIVLT